MAVLPWRDKISCSKLSVCTEQPNNQSYKNPYFNTLQNTVCLFQVCPAAGVLTRFT